MTARVPALSLALLLAVAASATAQDYKFEPSEFEKKPYEFGGFIEGKGEHLFLDRDSAFYRLNDPAGTNGSTNDRATGTLELYGGYTTGITSFGFRAHGSAESDADQGGTSSLTLLEGTVTLKPETGRTVEIGKKTLKWGKGYAWNPAGFVERPKDPSDPDLSREGFVMLTGDAIWSFPGAVRTVAITPVLLPVDWASMRTSARRRR